MGRIRVFFKIIICIFCISVVWAAVPLQAEGENRIRVCLSKGSYTAIFQVVEGDYFFQDMGNMLPIGELKPGDAVTINQAGNNVVISINNKQVPGFFTAAVSAVPKNDDDLNIFSYRNTLYRDGITICVDSGSLLALNNIDVEGYLYGVVGQEIGYTAPKEALKAQAVVSRTFALYYKGRNLKYDLGADTYSQVYGGYSAEQNISAEKIIDAVDETRGRVIYYNNKKTGKGELIQAFFHSNAGGYTENSENVWNEALPYLKAVPSKEDKSAETYSDETGDDWPATCYRWEKSFSLDEIKEAINSYNQKASVPINIGEFKGINLYRFNRDGITPNLSGRVTRMEFFGSAGSASVYRDNIRSIFALRSTKFDIASSGGSSIYVVKDSNGKKHRIDDINDLLIIDGKAEISNLDISGETCQIIGEAGISGLEQTISRITFVGQGFGHGIGMSQWGARGMALKGFTYEEIIDHYYNQGKDDGTITIERY